MASIIARVWVATHAPPLPPTAAVAPALALGSVLATLAVALGCTLIGVWLKLPAGPLLVPLLAGSPPSWIVSGVPTGSVWVAESAIGLRLRGSVDAFGFEATVTWKD